VNIAFLSPCPSFGNSRQGWHNYLTSFRVTNSCCGLPSHWSYFANLRSSEFTLSSASHFNALVHLSGNDISFTADGSLSLHLKSSKTDPYRRDCSLLSAPSAWLTVPSMQMASSTYSSLASTSPEPNSHQHFVFFLNAYTFPLSFMPPTAVKSGWLQQQPRLAYLHGSSNSW